MYKTTVEKIRYMVTVAWDKNFLAFENKVLGRILALKGRHTAFNSEVRKLLVVKYKGSLLSVSLLVLYEAVWILSY